MKNKLTVLGLVAATAFIFTSCTKDTDVAPGNQFAAPNAVIDAPVNTDSDNAFSERLSNQVSDDVYPVTKGNAQSENEYPTMTSNPNPVTINPTVDPVTPHIPAPILNTVNRMANTSFNNVKGEKRGTVGFKTEVPVSQTPNQPNVLPVTVKEPMYNSGNSSQRGGISGLDKIPDCYFPVVGVSSGNQLNY